MQHIMPAIGTRASSSCIQWHVNNHKHTSSPSLLMCTEQWINTKHEFNCYWQWLLTAMPVFLWFLVSTTLMLSGYMYPELLLSPNIFNVNVGEMDWNKTLKQGRKRLCFIPHFHYLLVFPVFHSPSSLTLKICDKMTRIWYDVFPSLLCLFNTWWPQKWIKKHRLKQGGP